MAAGFYKLFIFLIFSFLLFNIISFHLMGYISQKSSPVDKSNVLGPYGRNHKVKYLTLRGC